MPRAYMTTAAAAVATGQDSNENRDGAMGAAVTLTSTTTGSAMKGMAATHEETTPGTAAMRRGRQR